MSKAEITRQTCAVHNKVLAPHTGVLICDITHNGAVQYWANQRVTLIHEDGTICLAKGVSSPFGVKASKDEARQAIPTKVN
jgi:uncharacterized protein YbcV (DUF1398 family)